MLTVFGGICVNCNDSDESDLSNNCCCSGPSGLFKSLCFGSTIPIFPLLLTGDNSGESGKSGESGLLKCDSLCYDVQSWGIFQGMRVGNNLPLASFST